MKKILGLLLLTSVAFAGDKANLHGAQVIGMHSIENVLVNPSFEKNTNNWTASGGTFDVDSAAKVIGNSGAVWDSSSASQTLTSSSVTVPDGLKGRDGVAYCSIKAASGTATHTIQAYDGTNVLISKTITSDTSFFRKTEVNFVWPSSGTVALRLVSVASNEPSISIDDCFLGLANNIVPNQALLDWQSYTPTITHDTGSMTNATTTAYWKRVGDDIHLKLKIVFSGASSAFTGIYFTTPSGITMDTTKNTTSTGFLQGYVSIFDNGSGWYMGRVRNTSTSQFKLSNGSTNTSDAGTSADPLQSMNIDNGAPITFASGDEIIAYVSFPATGLTSQNGTTFENAHWKVDANIGGANPSLGVAAISTYQGITNGSLVLTNNSGTGNITAQIGCSSTNSPTGTTCSVGDESVAVSFTPQGQFPQDVEACFSFGWSGTAPSGTHLVPVFQVVETATNAQTILQEGRSRVPSGMVSGASATDDFILPQQICGTFTFTSGGQKMLRLFYEQYVTGSPSSSIISADGNSAVGQRDIHVTVRPITQSNRAPVLIGSVTSNSTGAERIERARITLVTGTPNLTSQSGSWISSITDNGVGDFTLNMPAGTWSAVPTCVCTGRNSAPNQMCVESSDTSATTTSVRIELGNDLGANSDASFNIICMGPR